MGGLDYIETEDTAKKGTKGEGQIEPVLLPKDLGSKQAD